MTIEEGLATVRLQGGRGNAINPPLIDALTAAFKEAEADPAVRGVLLAAAGKLFCPGLDILELITYDREQLHGFMKSFHACALHMYTFPKPVVAALSGHTLAGGCLLAITADWRVLVSGAMTGLNEVKVGVPIPFGMSTLLREELPGPRLEEVALFGRNFRDREAVDSGLVHEIHGPEGFEEYCRERLAELASRDPRAFAVTKKYLHSTAVERIRAHDAKFVHEFLDVWFQEDTQANIRIIAEGLARKKD
jgi:enoyl-CoA hydratase